jgi:hypothetical protein
VLNSRRLLIATVSTAAVATAAAVVWITSRTGANPTGPFDARIERIEPESQRALDSQVVASTVRARVERVVSRASGVEDREGAVAALSAPLVSATLADPAQLLAFVRNSSLRANRTTEQIDAMRRHFRTVGVYGERPAGYESLSNDEWLDLVDDASFEEIAAFYIQSLPRVAGWNWSDARVIASSPGEDPPNLQQEMMALAQEIGPSTGQSIFGGGRSFFTGDSSEEGESLPGRTLCLIIPGITESGGRFIVGMILSRSNDRWAPYSILRLQTSVPTDGESAAVPYMPVF